MKKLNLLLLAAVAVLCFTACSSAPKAESEIPSATTVDNSQNSLDWDGVYSNVLPCADCEGIQTTIVLNRENTYQRITRYLGEDPTALTEEGTFKWDEKGRKIILEGEQTVAPRYYLVEENRLHQLDIDGKEIVTENQEQYFLPKVDDVVGHYWKLIEVYGTPVPEEMHKEPFLRFQVQDNRLEGNAGCNSLSGRYIIRNGNRLEIPPLAMTMMACLDMEVESKMVKALGIVDSYTVLGDTLSLNRARMAPLAKFIRK
ncbi:copper resistance protein NlpE N-terminal domain-containing protein [Bacteroidales bacterium OttesenSCG-928-B11]|nr:copper resistance protein NlpE N-terminal domain-containing protein [Bacteroidales bacterium OttesenSCG-928-C03]MDL2311623.1 copper resistance protein NlpE N-terminal domain-containing protein [Bacteroidales bacterium OttesenSCG-928-B11]MDL2326757.1 copper resistance protein NlpE N-terminal domain-containing protein [Bacteroidales bacterium OttesenSCG-928-A14]